MNDHEIFHRLKIWFVGRCRYNVSITLTSRWPVKDLPLQQWWLGLSYAKGLVAHYLTIHLIMVDFSIGFGARKI